MKPTSRGVAMISGAGSGIGREVAAALARRGHALALVGRRATALEAVLAETGAHGLSLALDVRDAEAVEAAVRRVEAELGPIEVVLPAAGVARVAPFLEQTAAAFGESIATNLLGAANLFRSCLPGLVGRRRGHLLPILSVASRQGFPSWSAYCASKWGLAGLVAALREELKGSGVRLTSIVPGATDSSIWEGLPGDWDRSRMIPVAEISRAVVWALESGAGVEVEEIRLQPPGGNL
jgi:3-oxoacyl-[acyl-carrier protein] reductase